MSIEHESVDIDGFKERISNEVAHLVKNGNKGLIEFATAKLGWNDKRAYMKELETSLLNVGLKWYAAECDTCTSQHGEDSIHISTVLNGMEGYYHNNLM